MKTVTLAYEYIDAEGNKHDPDESIDLATAEANRLLNAGLARDETAAAGGAAADDKAPKTGGRRKAGSNEKEG